jgi:hypothetical protein
VVWRKASPQRAQGGTEERLHRPSNFLRQEIGENFLAGGEGALHLGDDEDAIREAAHQTEAEVVVDYVADQSAFNTVAGFGGEFVAVMPGLEWAFVLHIREVVVPLEFGDVGNPLGAQRKEGDDAEGGDDDCADTCCLLRRRAGGRRWRRRPGEAHDFCGAGGGHDARKVLGIGEEGEDAREREGNPLLEFEMVKHARYRMLLLQQRFLPLHRVPLMTRLTSIGCGKVRLL